MLVNCWSARPSAQPASHRTHSSRGHCRRPWCRNSEGVDLNPNDPHSVLSLILAAGPVVKVIIAMLLLASLVSWTIIFRKRRLVSQAEVEANKFEGVFWSGGDLGKLYRAIGARNKPPVGMESIFEAGFGEFTRLRSQSVPAAELLEGVRRTMRVAQLRRSTAWKRASRRSRPSAPRART